MEITHRKDRTHVNCHADSVSIERTQFYKKDSGKYFANLSVKVTDKDGNRIYVSVIVPDFADMKIEDDFHIVTD